MLNALIGILAAALVLLTACVIVFKQMDLRFCVAQGDSMLPSVEDGDKLLLNPEGEIRRFDIIVYEHENAYVLKRVIGLPGDEVAVLDGRLFVNREYYEEYYIDKENCRDFHDEDFKVTVPEGEYFVMGDNRDYSMDSREAGTVPEDMVLGLAIWKI